MAKLGQGPFRLQHPRACAHRLFFMARNRQPQRLKTSLRKIVIRFGSAQGAVCVGHCTIRIAARIPGSLIGAGLFGK